MKKVAAMSAKITSFPSVVFFFCIRAWMALPQMLRFGWRLWFSGGPPCCPTAFFSALLPAALILAAIKRGGRT